MTWLARAFAGLTWFVLVVVLAGPPAHAQVSQDIDTSIRAAGMGGADVAVPWGEASAWGNPATLGSMRGVRWEQSHTRLLPGLSDDVTFDARQLVLGAAGLGISLAGRPAGVGGVKLDFGTIEITDDTGTVLERFSAHETVDRWGYGVSAATLLDAAGGLVGWHPGLSRYADASFGESFKSTHLAMGPASFAGDARADNRDRGVLARVSPTAILRCGRAGSLDVDLAYGKATLNASDEMFVFGPGPMIPTPSTRFERKGWAATAVLHGPPDWIALTRRSRWLAGLDPIARLTWAHDSEHNSAGGSSSSSDVERSGTELVIAGVVEFRRGHVTDRAGGDGLTWGWGLTLPAGRWGGARYAHASVPQARNSGLPDVQRDGVSVWVDPLEWLASRREGVR